MQNILFRGNQIYAVGQTNTLSPVSERRLGGGKIVNYVKFKANMYYIYDAL